MYSGSSSIFATMNHGPSSSSACLRADSSSSSSRTVAAFVTPQAWAARARSVPNAVWVGWPPVWPHCSLSHAITTRFGGLSLPIVAIVPMFISSEPSPSREIILSGVDSAMPSAMDEHSPIEPYV